MVFLHFLFGAFAPTYGIQSLAATVGVWAALWLVSYFLREDPAKPKPGPQIERIPRTVEGEAVAFAFGHVRIDSPNVIWFGNPISTQFVNESDDGTNPPENPRSSANVQLALAISNVDIADTEHTAQARLVAYGLWAEDTRSSAGSWRILTETGQPPGVQTAFIEVVLGDQGQGLLGVMEFNPGRWDTDNGLWATQAFTASTDPFIDIGLVPPYRGFVTCMLSGGLGGISGPIQVGMGFGTSYAMPRVAIEFINPVAYPTIDQGIMEFNDGDVNPVGFCLRLLTGGWGGRKIDPSLIDVASAIDCAEVLFLEQNGMSGNTYAGQSVRSLLNAACEQSEMIVQVHPETNLVHFGLIRDDYDVGLLDIVDVSVMTRTPEWTFVTFADTSNLKKINFTDRDKGFRADSVLIPDQANFDATGRRRVSEESFPYVTNARNANRIGARLLRAEAFPLAKLRVGVKRGAVFWYIGKPFIYTHPTNGKQFVMRVLRNDVGGSDDGEIVLDAIQDRWSYGTTVFPDPDTVGPTAPLPPLPPPRQLTTETPRWLYNGGDQTHLLYLAAPSTGSTRYWGRLDDEDPAHGEVVDALANAFSGTATVAVAYTRTAEPFDSVGLTIEGLLDWSPSVVSEAHVRTRGYNLIQVGAEIMAFRSYTDLGGGQYLLEDVDRALLDTAAVEHAVGESVWLIDPRRLAGVGAAVVLRDEVVLTRIFEGRGTAQPADADVGQETLTVRGRAMLPAPVVDLKINTLKSAIEVEEEGIAVTWKRRSRLATDIPLGSDADDAAVPEAVTYAVLAGSLVVTTAANAASAALVPLAEAGHGTLAVSVRSQRDVVEGVDTTTLYSWQSPVLDVVAFHWRNLLREARLDAGFDAWEPLAGTPVEVDSGPYLDYQYVKGTASDNPTEWAQKVAVTGYRPRNMRATLTFKSKSVSGASSTLEADLISLDAADNPLDTAALAPTSIGATNWGQQVLEIATLDVDTDALQVRFEQAGDGIGGAPSAAVTDPRLMLGQFTDQLLANPSLSGTTGWTVVTGGFTTETSTPAEGADYVRSGANTTNTLEQSGITVDPGWAYSTAVIEIGTRANTASYAGSATVKVEVLSSAPAVIATATKTVTGLSTTGWTKTRVNVDVPGAAATLRVTVSNTAPTTANLIDWDDGDLRLFKDLSSREEVPLDFSDPYHQALPATPYRWVAEYGESGIPVPTLGWFAGQAHGELGNEPELLVEPGVYLARVNLPEAFNAYEFRGDGKLVRARTDSRFGNRTRAQSFSGRIVFTPGDDASYGLCGRLGDTGWEVDVLTYVPRVRLVGTLGTITATAGAGAAQGGPTFVAWTYDSATSFLRITTPSGTVSTSTAGMGEINCDELIAFCIGDASVTTPDTMTGTIARVEMWNEVLDGADFIAAWKWGTRNWGAQDPVDFYPSASGAVACAVSSDADGELIGLFPTQCLGLWAKVGTTIGLPLSPARTSLVPANPNVATNWGVVGSPTITLNAARAPNGKTESVRIAGGSTAGRKLTLTALNSALKVNLSFRARATVSGTATVEARVGASPCGSTNFAVTTLWQRIDLSITLSGNADGLVWYPASAGSATIEIAGPMFVDQSSVALVPPIAIPVFGTDSESSLSLVMDPVLDAQYLSEGEIEATVVSLTSAVPSGTLARLTSAGSEEPRLYLASGELRFAHYDGAGSGVISEVTETSFAVPRTLRGRWNRAGLLDAAGAFAGAVSEAGADFDRVATWTPDAAGFALLEIGNNGGTDQPGLLLSTLTVRTRESIL